MKICTKCKGSFPATLEFFYRCANSKSGLRSSCKECHRLVSDMTRDKDKARLRLQEWRKRNPEEYFP